MAGTQELATQFTEDVLANEDRICQRPACAAKICKGEPCLYIATVILGQPGRFVCKQCHQYYQHKVATEVRTTRMSGQSSCLSFFLGFLSSYIANFNMPASMMVPPPDPYSGIRHSVNVGLGQRSLCLSFALLPDFIQLTQR